MRQLDQLPQLLLSAALRVLWAHGRAGDAEGVRLLAERVPGFTADQYTEAGRCAAVLNGAAYELAAAWFADRGRTSAPTPDELECLCPGFAAQDYRDAAENALLWARK